MKLTEVAMELFMRIFATGCWKKGQMNMQIKEYFTLNENGLYEKYGYTFYKMMKDINGEDSRVYFINVE